MQKKIERLEHLMSDKSLHHMNVSDTLILFLNVSNNLLPDTDTLFFHVLVFMRVRDQDLEARSRVLERLGYISTDYIVLLKGRVACEVRTDDRLVSFPFPGHPLTSSCIV